MIRRTDVEIFAKGSEGGGAALDQVIGLTVAAVVVAGVLLWVGYLHRSRKITWLASVAERFSRRFHRPPWELAVFVFVPSIICALFGFIWDVSLHIGKGRDPGPLANPAHYFILVGLFLIFIGGMVAVAMPYEKPGTAAVRITRNWYAPVGGVLLAGCGLYALLGFPLDDIWHRLFGQDVTLWGPTHLMLIGGAGFSLIGMLLLEQEGRRSVGPAPEPERLAEKLSQYLVAFMRYLAFGGLLIGMSVFQVEYDFGVPQFRLAFQPMLIAAAAALALVAARVTLGRGAAIAAALLAIVLRGAVAVLVGPVLGAPISWFPLYLGPAVVVEAIALTPLIRRPLAFGLISGLGVATVGLWLESLWIGAVYHYPWPTSMWDEALAMAIPVAVLLGACGALLGLVLTGEPLPRRAKGLSVVVLAVLVTGTAVANGLQYRVPDDATATITLTDQPGSGVHRAVSADVRINPPSLVSADPEWVSILSWQGGLSTPSWTSALGWQGSTTSQRGLVVDRLQRLGPGHYRSTEPIPVHGNWKTLLRIHDGKTLAAVPIYLPNDPGIGAAEVPATASMTRPFVHESTILQRERNPETPPWLWTTGCLVVLVCSLILIAALTWGAGRVNRTETPAEADQPSREHAQV